MSEKKKESDRLCRFRGDPRWKSLVERFRQPVRLPPGTPDPYSWGKREWQRPLECLQRAYPEDSASPCGLRIGTFSDTLRCDPRFHDLLRRMNFPP